jgi:hypothetical protein
LQRPPRWFHEALIDYFKGHRMEVRILVSVHSLITCVEDDAPSLIVLCDGLLDMTAAAMLQSSAGQATITG